MGKGFAADRGGDWAVAGMSIGWGAFLRGVLRRAQAGDGPQPWWAPRRVLTVVSADVDASAGVAAVWIMWRAKSSRRREHIALLELREGRWRYVGGGSGPVDEPVGVEVLDVGAGAKVLRRAHDADLARALTEGVWIAGAPLRLGPDVGHVLVGARRIENPDHRGVVAVWVCPYHHRDARPVITALGRDGVELSRIGPYEALDTHTRARLRERW
ncbi:hypothetical protein [Streptomyces sp. NPDC021608]|uniref:hypothetical protein n=1 Tax=Streptomyces sp. NPDC021608 TaxID=3154903 RepID=UPI0033EF254C